MARGIEAIKVIDAAVGLGFSVRAALQRALDRTLTEFASGKPYSIQSVSMCLSGYEGRVYPEIRDDLCAELEVPREYIDRLIDSQRAAEGVA